MEAVFSLCEGMVGLTLVPADVVVSDLDASVEPLIQVALRGDAAGGGFGAGHTLRDGGSLKRLGYREQTVEHSPGAVTVTTVLEAGETIFRHVLRHRRGQRVLQVRTEVDHEGTQPLVLEMVSSFTLGAISPLEGGRGPGALAVHRIRSTWSNEGRVVCERVEDLQLEPSWSHHGVRVERFGQVGSLPVRKFFPFVAVEDLRHGVVWAVQLACPSSWQIEVSRRGEALSLSGGLADFELGHWTKTLAPGGRLITPWAFLTVGHGTLDAVSQRLLDLYDQDDGPRPRELPIVFNEFCSTWGQPSEARVNQQLGALKGRGFDYFVIDAGWYADPEGGWEQGHGDWVVAPHLFPGGLGRAVHAIREAGLRPGLWFEWETCGPRSRGFQNEDHLLRRHGHTITSGQRRFWDMSDPWVVQYLSETVIGRLRDDGFDYLKVDYNESVGVGCDGAESLGEGLRQRILASQAFLTKIRREVPGLVVENCASGGHRLEPSMVGLTDYSSFSDAHECPEIPVIAANLHRVIPPRQSQIWAVLRKSDSDQRLVYSLAATFLGVPCVSGEVEDLSESQWTLVESAFRFHRRIAPLLWDGTTFFLGPRQQSYRNLQGWQAILRLGSSNQEALVVLHTFGGTLPSPWEIPLPWPASIAATYGLNPGALTVVAATLRGEALQGFDAVAVLLVREPPA